MMIHFKLGRSSTGKEGVGGKQVAGVARASSGTTLIETLVSTFVTGVLFVAVYGGITGGFRMLQLSRENLRATQILVEKMEGARLFNWDQVNSNGFIPTYFTQSYYSNAASGNSGVIYRGHVTVTNVPFATPYAPEMKLIEVEVTWDSALNMKRSRKIRTYVAQYGLQNYLY